MPFFLPKHATESAYSFRVRLGEPDLPYNEDDFWDLMDCPKGHQHIHSTSTRGDRIGEQFIFVRQCQYGHACSLLTDQTV